MSEVLNAIIAASAGLAGVALGAKLNFHAAHKTWVVDNKKLEWRELIDAVQEALTRMAYAIYDPPKDAISDQRAKDLSKSVQRVFVVLNNRMFVAEVVAREKLEDRWNEINGYVNKVIIPTYRPDEQAMVSFEHERKAFRQRLNALSRKDLRIPSD